MAACPSCDSPQYSQRFPARAVTRRRRLTGTATTYFAALTCAPSFRIDSVLAICGLPYTRQPLEIREFERRQGRMSLVVEAGKLRNPETGDRIA